MVKTEQNICICQLQTAYLTLATLREEVHAVELPPSLFNLSDIYEVDWGGKDRASTARQQAKQMAVQNEVDLLI